MANEPSIIEMNEAICEFMGWEFKPDGEDWFRAYHDGGLMWADTSYGLEQILLKGFKYHKDWNKLMPVVEKIESVQLDDKRHVVVRASANVQIFYKACIITYEPDEEAGDTNEGAAIQTKGETKLEAVYQAVYQFIIWYNQQKQNETTSKK